MKNIIVLGSGMVGRAIAIDLSRNYPVTAVDINPVALDLLASYPNINPLRFDLTQMDGIRSLVQGYNLVIGAVPGHLGFEVLKQVISAGKNVVDISFFPENPFLLDTLAKQHNVTAVVDCGVAPGLGNIILGYHNRIMDVDRFVCLVGGLPLRRKWPWQYATVFSPPDVIEEYVRPARFMQQGKMVTREALSDPELVEFDEVGTLEAWNSDGLRTLLTTMHIPDMIEKTLRYPGTIEYLRVLRESGFFSSEEVAIGNHKIKPVDLSSILLSKQWELKPGEEDFTVMRITISGSKKEKRQQYTCHLFDRYDRETGTLSMARTTGYTCSAVATLILEQGNLHPGICPPEFIGEDPCRFEYIIRYLRERNVNISINS